jgi:soluble lytic murein transglycosylase-like protein
MYAYYKDKFMQFEQALYECELDEGFRSKAAALGLAAALNLFGGGKMYNQNLKTDFYQAPVSYVQTINPEDAKPAEPVFTSKWDSIIEKYINQDLFSISQIVQIIQAESTNNPAAVSKAGQDSGLGLMQVSKVLLIDYNERHHTDIQQEELLDPETNIKVACWFLNSIPRRIGLDEIPVTNESLSKVYAAYNVGIRNFNNYYSTHYSKGIDPKSGKDYHGIVRLNTAKEELIKQT